MKRIDRYVCFVCVFLISLIACFGCNWEKSIQNQQTEALSERTQTVSVNPTIQVTPLQITYPEDTEKEMIRLMSTNNDCVGFCFLGIVPGKTNFQQAIEFVQALTGKENSSSQSYLTEFSSSFEFFENKLYAYIHFSDAMGVVDDFEAKVVGLGREDVPADTWIAFRPDNTLLKSGSPDEIFIVMSQGPEGRVSYAMYFAYPEGYIYYSGNQTIILPEHIMTACPNMPHNLDAFRFVSGSKNGNLNPGNGIVPINQASLLNKDEVFTILTSGKESACINLDYKMYRSNVK